ncbi:dTMP kinase [Aeromicrobium marinum DSM 15272]|uniref:Thymidylate kinase n=1 Tax=Aeromicrobium marinum DSM 15272 TaxID=585531 RepID=E2SFJ4_9ACTN|nr:dTMP kinase [Aeromicrobium marinum]EFQ82095.1 dTMP kinase [Aeromicrobium marinum DSM 15272]
MPYFTDSGVFVALEGGEGGGKSTQSGLLASWLTERGHQVLVTREPGGTPVGSQLRRIVLDPATGALNSRTEALIYAADKAEHVEALVLPALAAGQVVLTDRYVDSTLAYQGAGRAIDVQELEHVARWATADLRPHLTVVLDIDPVVGLARAGEPDRIEAEPLAFHRRVREHFLRLAAADPDHYLVVDADRPAEQVQADIRGALTPWLSRSTTRPAAT